VEELFSQEEEPTIFEAFKEVPFISAKKQLVSILEGPFALLSSFPGRKEWL